MMIAITKLREKHRGEPHPNLVSDYFALARQFKDHFCREGSNPHFVGIWDTVSSVGWIENPVRLPFTANSPDIASGRHCHCDRRAARVLPYQTLARRTKGLQASFPGADCDVGGGYPEVESGLSKIALDCMNQGTSRSRCAERRQYHWIICATQRFFGRI
jgi:uncharacterized protein (DUF2235 family)